MCVCLIRVGFGLILVLCCLFLWFVAVIDCVLFDLLLLGLCVIGWVYRGVYWFLGWFDLVTCFSALVVISVLCSGAVALTSLCLGLGCYGCYACRLFGLLC